MPMLSVWKNHFRLEMGGKELFFPRSKDWPSPDSLVNFKLCFWVVLESKPCFLPAVVLSRVPNSGMWKGDKILGWLHLILEKEASAWLMIKTRISCGFLNLAEFEVYFPLTWLVFKWKFSTNICILKSQSMFCLVPDGELGTTTPSLHFSKTCLKNVFSVILLFIYLLLMAVAVFLVYQTISDFREKLKHPVMSVTYKEVSLYDAPGKSGNKRNGLSSHSCFSCIVLNFWCSFSSAQSAYVTLTQVFNFLSF